MCDNERLQNVTTIKHKTIAYEQNEFNEIILRVIRVIARASRQNHSAHVRETLHINQQYAAYRSTRESQTVGVIEHIDLVLLTKSTRSVKQQLCNQTM